MNRAEINLARRQRAHLMAEIARAKAQHGARSQLTGLLCRLTTDILRSEVASTTRRRGPAGRFAPASPATDQPASGPDLFTH